MSQSGVLSPGNKAPDFTLHCTPDQAISLGEFKGIPVILVFYPADWSPVCGDELAIFNEVLPEFEQYNAVLLGLSVDGVWCHTAYRKERNFHFPLLSDFEPKGAVSRLYGAYREQEGFSERALFVIDETGVIHWSYLSPVGVNPGANGILKALKELQVKKEEMANAK